MWCQVAMRQVCVSPRSQRVVQMSVCWKHGLSTLGLRDIDLNCLPRCGTCWEVDKDTWEYGPSSFLSLENSMLTLSVRHLLGGER